MTNPMPTGTRGKRSTWNPCSAARRRPWIALSCDSGCGSTPTNTPTRPVRAPGKRASGCANSNMTATRRYLRRPGHSLALEVLSFVAAFRLLRFPDASGLTPCPGAPAYDRTGA